MDLVALRQIETQVGSIEKGQRFGAPDTTAEEMIAAGAAAKAGTRLVWPELVWTGSTVVVIASGPSLTKEDCELVRSWRYQPELLIGNFIDGYSETLPTIFPDRRVIVINTSYKLAPWADILYACDERWWEFYYAQVREKFAGALWTQDEKAAKRHGIHYVQSESGQGLNRKPGIINQGANGGYQAVGLAYLAGAAKIVLLGFDMSDWSGKLTHWHEDHPGRLRTFPQYNIWLVNFNRLAKDFKGTGVEVVNATRATAMTCFPRVVLENVLQEEA